MVAVLGKNAGETPALPRVGERRDSTGAEIQFGFWEWSWVRVSRGPLTGVRATKWTGMGPSSEVDFFGGGADDFPLAAEAGDDAALGRDFVLTTHVDHDFFGFVLIVELIHELAGVRHH